MLVGQDLAVLECSRHQCDCGWGWVGSQEAGPCSSQVSLSWAFPSWLSAAPWWLQRDPQAKPQERVAAPCQRSLLRGREKASGAAPVHQPALLPPHLQVLQGLVHDTWVREAAGPEGSKVGWVKLLVLLLVFKVIVKPGTLLLIPKESLHGCQALVPQVPVLCGFSVILWGNTLCGWSKQAPKLSFYRRNLEI